MAQDSVRKASLGATTFRLAHWLEPEQRYQRRYVPVDPEGGVVSDQPGLHNDSKVRLWTVRSWDGGEGLGVWRPDRRRYRESDGVTLVGLGDGLQLARKPDTTQDSSGVADFGEGGRFGFGLGRVWSITDGSAHSWDAPSSRWSVGVTTGAGVSAATSLTDGDDTFMYSSHEDLKIYRWKSGSNAVWYNTATGDDFVSAPVVRSWGGRLFALDGDDLYEVDKTAADTRTIRVDLTGESGVFLAETPLAYNRMSLSDKGPIWLQRLDNGQTFIHEYNVESDTHEIIGKLAVDFATPYSIFFTQGFVFVGFRYANDHDEPGVAYLHFNRGAQRGVTGPFRAPTGVTAGKPVLVAGQIGDDLICYFDGYVWAYNLTDAGIRMVAAETLPGGPATDVTTFGQEIFVGPFTGGEVERYLADEYVASGTLTSGRFDIQYPGLEKLLTNVGVVTDPLPADTSVTVDVSWDGETFDSLTGAHDTDGARRFTWAGSSPGADKIGYELEWRVSLATTDSTVTPVVRQVWASVTSVAHRIEWVLAVDCSNFSDKDIDALNGLIGSTHAFTDPYQNRPSDASDSVVVTVEDVITPERFDQNSTVRAHALLRLRSRDLVGILGSS